MGKKQNKPSPKPTYNPPNPSRRETPRPKADPIPNKRPEPNRGTGTEDGPRR